MRPTTLLILSILLLVDAGVLHAPSSLSARHHDLFHWDRQVTPEKRCPNRKSKSIKLIPSPAALAANTQPTPSAQHDDRLIQVGGNCAPNRATTQVTSLSGPNGHIDWMNCGFEGAGWNPPKVQIQDLITVPLRVALQDPESPFKQCAPYIELFEKWGNIYGISPIILASFAMQESSCQPWVVGGAGEQGLMQITTDKCDGAPLAGCRDPDFNIGAGAKYFSRTLVSNDGDFFRSLGGYNGWYPYLTQTAAFSAADSPCCLCQNNGDYLFQFTNGWLLNINPRTRRLGKYFNLERCHR